MPAPVWTGDLYSPPGLPDPSAGDYNRGIGGAAAACTVGRLFRLTMKHIYRTAPSTGHFSDIGITRGEERRRSVVTSQNNGSTASTWKKRGQEHVKLA